MYFPMQFHCIKKCQRKIIFIYIISLFILQKLFENKKAIIYSEITLEFLLYFASFHENKNIYCGVLKSLHAILLHI